MSKRTIVAVLAAALTLSACGDSTAPKAITLTTAQASDMMDALAAIGAFNSGLMRTSAGYLAGKTALLTSTIDQTTSCPSGGTYRQQGTFNINDTYTSISATITQSYNACKGTSSSGTLWTFNGAPNIVMSFSMTSNQSTGAFTMNGTEKGAFDVSSTVGSGRCNIDLTFSVTGNSTTGAGSGSVTGTVCGTAVNETI